MRIPDAERRRRVWALAERVDSAVRATAADVVRAEELRTLGFGAVDSLHIACAERAACSVLLTTDDRLLRMARTQAPRLRVQVANPVVWLRKERSA
ncbi:MAG: PIN domain-containing protein [Candidatus Latescibacterota bacterium]